MRTMNGKGNLAQRRKDADKRLPQNAFPCVFASLREVLLTLCLCAAITTPAFGAKHTAKPVQKAPPAVIESTPLPANAERLSHGRFDSLAVYQPQGTPTSFVLFLSGDAG